MKRLVWSRLARRDLDLIEAFLLKDRPEAVAGLIDGTRQACRFLQSTPLAGSPIDAQGLRKWRIGRTPYLLMYVTSASEIRIARVFHERQNWRENL